jgi:hypothetical protein
MALLNYDVIVTSLAGSGHWIAVHLQRSGLRVLLLDLTKSLSSFSSEEIEGPFGIDKHENFEATFAEYLSSQDLLRESDVGKVYWFSDGPIETKGPVAAHHFKEKTISELIGKLEASLSSTTYLPEFQIKSEALTLQASQRFYFRFASRQGYIKGLDWVQQNGVKALTQTDCIDLVMTEKNKAFHGLELRGEMNGLVQCQHIVWALSQADSKVFFSSELNNKLFQQKLIEPDFCWLRFHFAIDSCSEFLRLPMHSIWIEDVESPWVRENRIVVCKTPSADRIDVWMMLPHYLRFNRTELLAQSDHILKIFKHRMPVSSLQLVSLPSEASPETPKERAARFPVWEIEKKINQKKSYKFKNVFFSSNETYENYTSLNQLQQQKVIAEEILSQWRLRQSLQSKERQV